MTTPAPANPRYLSGTWEIDPVHSEVAFVIRHMMVSKVRGRFDRFTGTIVTGTKPSDSSATATVELGSINTNNAQRDGHIRTADFFDVDNHPTMSFVSTGVRSVGSRFRATGDLTIRGVTRPIELVVELNGISADPYGGTRIGLSAKGEINRHDFGVSYNGPIPGGGAVLGDRVTIELEVEAVRQS